VVHVCLGYTPNRRKPRVKRSQWIRVRLRSKSKFLDAGQRALRVALTLWVGKMTGQTFGYLRVSSLDQNTIRQLDVEQLDRVFMYGASRDRPCQKGRRRQGQGQGAEYPAGGRPGTTCRRWRSESRTRRGTVVGRDGLVVPPPAKDDAAGLVFAGLGRGGGSSATGSAARTNADG
jgi:hypothetical protein